MKAGFLGGPQKRAPAKKAEPKPTIEDVTHIKAKGKNDNLKMDEVQEAMKAS